MGLIRAALSSVSGVISEQWKDFFKCESMSADVLAVRGRKVGHRAGDDVITDGSVLVQIARHLAHFPRAEFELLE